MITREQAKQRRLHWDNADIVVDNAKNCSLGAFLTLKYSDDQPREPAGSSEGGQFAGGSGGSRADATRQASQALSARGIKVLSFNKVPKAAREQMKMTAPVMTDEHVSAAGGIAAAFEGLHGKDRKSVV